MTTPRRRDQSGFTLALTLVLILLTTLVFGALFGLLSLTVKTTKASEVAAREATAADAAVEAAIVQMRGMPDSCARSSQAVLRDKVFDQGTPQIGDDVKVTVECEPVGGAASSIDQVRIVGGDGYQGAVKWNTDCSGALTVPACTPWTSLLGATPFQLAGSKPGLVHTGPESLRFASGVTVRGGAAVLGSTPAGGGPAKPAVTVTGRYVQGAPGLRLDGAAAPGVNGCGVLGVVDGPAHILDSDAAPECDNAEARAVDSDPTALEAESGLVAPVAKPSIPATCGAGPVVTFQPGTYDATMVGQLNRLLNGSVAACHKKTFWFSPGGVPGGGIYSFDGPTLEFADAGSSYVFGAPLGWNATTGVPATLSSDATAPLCDQAVAGSTAVLSARTALRHSGGRFAVCPASAPSGKPYPALYQMTSVPSVVALNATPPLPRVIVYGCDPTWDYIDWGAGICTATRNFDFTIRGEGAEKLDSLRVLLTATEGNRTQNNLIEGRKVKLQLFGAPALNCETTFVNGTPNGGYTLAYELLSGTCAAKLRGRTPADLNGLVVRVAVQLGLRQMLPFVFAQQPFTVTGAQTQINALPGTAAAAAFSSPTGDWLNVAQAAVADGVSAQPKMSCDQMVCQAPLPTRTRDPLVADNTRRFRMDITGGLGFAGLADYTAAGIDARVSSLRVDVDMTTAQKTIPPIFGLQLDPRHFRADMNVRLELRTPRGNRCVAHEGGVNGGAANERQQLSFSVDTADDLENGGSCNHAIRSFDELTDPATRLTLIIEMPCVRNPDPRADWLCFQEIGQDDHVWAVRPPGIDRVAVYASTDSYLGAPAVSAIAIDAAAPAPRKVFRSFGRVWLPLTDLDIHWQGDGGTATLFNNDLVLHGLGSDMVTGATTAFVCCGRPDTREVRLRALVDGRVRVLATVRYTDITPAPNSVYSPGAEVDVLDWRRGRLAGN